MNVYRLSRDTFELCIRILFKLKVYGKEKVPEPPYIAVSNHASLVDPPLVGVACKKDDIDFMGKKELFDTPIVWIWARNVGLISVDRKAKSVSSLKIALKRLKKGRSVGIFPEGTRSEDGQLQDAKRGIGFLIAKARVPVVPVYVEGSEIALPRTGGLKMGSPITVYVGKTIPPEAFTTESDQLKIDYGEIANKVMKEIAYIKETKPKR